MNRQIQLKKRKFMFCAKTRQLCWERRSEWRKKKDDYDDDGRVVHDRIMHPPKTQGSTTPVVVQNKIKLIANRKPKAASRRAKNSQRRRFLKKDRR
jgi:hypothetical protein